MVEKEHKEHKHHNALGLQSAASLLGEIVGTTMSIGAVYTFEKLMPGQHRRVSEWLANHIAGARNVHGEEAIKRAASTIEFITMNIGNFVNMGTQIAFRRAHTNPEERPPMRHEFGRQLTGFAARVTSSWYVLGKVHKNYPNFLDHDAQGMVRFGKLLKSDMVQTASGVVADIPAQLLYTKLVAPKGTALTQS